MRKIKKVAYAKGEAKFVIEGIDNVTFCIELETKNKIKDVTDALKDSINKIMAADADKDKYDTWKLKDLEGTDI